MKFKGDKPCLFIHPRCKNLIEELEGYRYADKKGKSNIKEEPIKLADHACDALRYGLYSYEKGFIPRSYRGSFL
jgi:phage terminase large subunit